MRTSPSPSSTYKVGSASGLGPGLGMLLLGGRPINQLHTKPRSTPFQVAVATQMSHCDPKYGR